MYSTFWSADSGFEDFETADAITSARHRLPNPMPSTTDDTLLWLPRSMSHHVVIYRGEDNGSVGPSV